MCAGLVMSLQYSNLRHYLNVTEFAASMFIVVSLQYPILIPGIRFPIHIINTPFNDIRLIRRHHILFTIQNFIQFLQMFLTDSVVLKHRDVSTHFSGTRMTLCFPGGFAGAQPAPKRRISLPSLPVLLRSAVTLENWIVIHFGMESNVRFDAIIRQ